LPGSSPKSTAGEEGFGGIAWEEVLLGVVANIVADIL